MGFIEDIKKPINLLMLFIAVISMFGTIISIVLVLVDSRKNEISYAIEGSTKIVDSKLTGPKIRVFGENNKEITSDIYSSSILLWNSGDYPINPENIRVTPSINIKGIDQLISDPVITESHPLITKFQLLQDTIDKNKFDLNWKYFDPGHAIRINFLHTAKDNVSFDIEISGNILGINKFNQVKFDLDKNKILWRITLMVISLVLIFLSLFSLMKNKDIFPSKFKSFFVVIIVISSILLLFAFITFLNSIKTPIF
jgi:hypothetical protein